jgi:hypothetical protein
MNSKLERFWKETHNLTRYYYLNIFQLELRKTTKNQGYPIYRSGFEPGLYGIRIKCGTHATAMIDATKEIKSCPQIEILT